MRERLAALLLGLLFLVQGACFLNRPGIDASEVVWGPVKGALFAALFSVTHRGPESLRLTMLLTGALTVFLACRLLQRVAGEAALAGGVLLATDSTFLLTTRLDSQGVVLPRLFLVAGCWLVLRFWRNASRTSLALGFLCWGLGCARRPEFALVLVSLSAATAIVFASEIAAAWGWRNWLPAGLAFLCGLAPLLARRPQGVPQAPPFNVLAMLDGSAWFRYTVRSEPGTWGVGPKGFLEKACVAVAHAFRDPQHNLMAVAVLASLALGAIASFRPSWPHRRALRFTIAAGVIGLILMPHGPLLLLLPIPHLAVGVVLAAAARRSIFGVVALCAVTAAVAVSNLAVNAAYDSHAVLYGGTREFTEAIYNLAADFEVHDARRIRILTPGIEAPLQFLRAGTLPVVTGSSGEDTLFITGTGGDSGSAILAATEGTGRRIRLARVIQDYQGRSIFILFRLE